MLRKFRVKINQKEYLVEMEELTPAPQVGSAPVQVAPTPVPTPVVPTPTPTPVSSGEGEAVNAPMPGTILDVMVKVGDRVEVDQPLVILEAMKMENEIVAPKAGVISEVCVNKNDAIDVGGVIVRIA